MKNVIKLILIGEFDPKENKMKFAYANFLNCNSREELKILPNINKEIRQVALFIQASKPRFKCEVIYNLKNNHVSWSKVTWLVNPKFYKHVKLKTEDYRNGMPAVIYENLEEISSNVFSKSINKKLMDLKLDFTHQGELCDDLFETILF